MVLALSGSKLPRQSLTLCPKGRWDKAGEASPQPGGAAQFGQIMSQKQEIPGEYIPATDTSQK